MKIAPPELDGAFQVVCSMLSRGAPFEHIEAYVDNCGLSEEARAVLWLYAWCGGQANELRQIVSAGEPATA